MTHFKFVKWYQEGKNLINYQFCSGSKPKVHSLIPKKKKWDEIKTSSQICIQNEAILHKPRKKPS